MILLIGGVMLFYIVVTQKYVGQRGYVERIDPKENFCLQKNDSTTTSVAAFN